MVKKLIFTMLAVPFLLMSQGYRHYLTEYALFGVTDTLFATTAITSGWVDIGFLEGAANLSFQFQESYGDTASTAGDVTVEVQVADAGFWAGVWDDSVSTSADGWMTIAIIDSACIADSVSWLLPLADQAWWNRVDLVRFRLTGATADSVAINKETLKGW